MNETKVILIPAKPHIFYTGRPDALQLQLKHDYPLPPEIIGIKMPVLEDYGIYNANFGKSTQKWGIPNIDYWILLNFIFRGIDGYKFIFYNSNIRHKGKVVLNFLNKNNWLLNSDYKIRKPKDLKFLLNSVNANINESYFICDDLDFMMQCEEIVPPVMHDSSYKKPESNQINYRHWGSSGFWYFNVNIPPYRYNSRRDIYALMPSIYNIYKFDIPQISFINSL